MSLRRWGPYGHVLRLGSGVLDAGLSSLAGFAASLYAVRFLDAPELGAFALYLSASVVASLVPQHLLFLPAQIRALELPAASRTAILRSTLLRGAGLAVLVGPLVAGAGLIAGSHVTSNSLLALASGAVVLTALTPMQDHVRSTLYLAERARRPAIMSALQMTATVSLLSLLHVLNVSPAWVPFTALGVGTAASLALGLLLASPPSHGPGLEVTTLALIRVGRPLLPAALIQEATVFAANAILVALTSAATLGTAEAARVVSRPVQTLSLGISRSLAPRLMESGQARSVEAAKIAVTLYVAVIGAAGLAYLVVAGWSYPHSPFVALLPAAYEKDGLVAVFLLATTLGAIAQVPRGILLGASQGRTILLITAFATLVRLGAVALLATALGAYALPSAQVAGLVVTGWLGARAALSLLKRPEGVH